MSVLDPEPCWGILDIDRVRGGVFGSVGKTLVLYAPVWYLLVLHNLLTTLTRVFRADSVL